VPKTNFLAKAISGYSMVMNIYLHSKRILSVIFLILGAVLIFFVPENTWIGVALFTLGIGIEIAGLILRHGKQKDQ
jgi:hypothetical protein